MNILHKIVALGPGPVGIKIRGKPFYILTHDVKLVAGFAGLPNLLRRGHKMDCCGEELSLPLLLTQIMIQRFVNEFSIFISVDTKRIMSFKKEGVKSCCSGSNNHMKRASLVIPVPEALNHYRSVFTEKNTLFRISKITCYNPAIIGNVQILKTRQGKKLIRGGLLAFLFDFFPFFRG